MFEPLQLAAGSVVTLSFWVLVATVANFAYYHWKK